MKQWLERRMGITPELVERAKKIEIMARSRAEDLPAVVNRRVLVLLPKEKYFAWKAQCESHRKDQPTADDPVLDRWANARAYLVDIDDPERELAPLIARYRKYFLDSYVNGHAPKSHWPWSPSEDEFPEWFDVHLVGCATRDLGKQALSSQADLLTALGADLGFGLEPSAAADDVASQDRP